MKLKAKTLGSRIQEARKQKGISQAELAEACNISVNHMSLIEHDKHTPRTVPTLVLIVEYLDISIDDILFGMSVTRTEHPINGFLDSLGEAEKGALEIARQFEVYRKK